jgi:hypothetical protein
MSDETGPLGDWKVCSRTAGFVRERPGTKDGVRYQALYDDVKGGWSSAGTLVTEAEAVRAWQRAEDRQADGRSSGTLRTRQRFRRHVDDQCCLISASTAAVPTRPTGASDGRPARSRTRHLGPPSIRPASASASAPRPPPSPRRNTSTPSPKPTRPASPHWPPSEPGTVRSSPVILGRARTSVGVW